MCFTALICELTDGAIMLFSIIELNIEVDEKQTYTEITKSEHYDKDSEKYSHYFFIGNVYS